MKAVDCQGFAGGFTLGVVQAGFELVGKRELPGGFGAASCLVNRHLLGEDWDYEEGPWEEWTPKDVEFVFGNPPCSGFSLLSHKDFRGPDSPINSCMWAFAEYVARCSPQIAAFESVQGAFKQGRALMLGLRDHVEQLTGDTWYLYHVLHNGYSVGGSAIRRRYFFVISRIPFGVETYPLERVPVLDDVIGDLRGLRLKVEDQRYRRKKTSWWVDEWDLRRSDGYVDGHYCIENPVVERVKWLMEFGWNHGENISTVARRVYEEGPDAWPDDGVMQRWVEKGFMLGYNQSYRWYPGRACRVVTGSACTHVIHPHEDRLLTLREVYRIQGFPDDWRLAPAVEMVDSLTKPTHWPGKGIPVQAGRWLGSWVREALDGNPGAYQGEVIGRRERVIDITHDWKRVYDERKHVHQDSMNKQLRQRFEERPA